MILALLLLLSDHQAQRNLAKMQRQQIQRFENYAKDYEAAQVMVQDMGPVIVYGQFEMQHRWYDLVSAAGPMTLSPCSACEITVDPPEWKGWNEVRTI